MIYDLNDLNELIKNLCIIYQKKMADFAVVMQRYKEGGHVHLGSHLDCEKSPEEIEKIRAVERQIVEAAYAYEIEQGNIRLVNGLFEYGPGVLDRLPRYRDESNLMCCVNEENC